MTEGRRKGDPDFEDLKLHVGDRLQLELPSSFGEQKHFTSLIGYVKGVSIMVRNPVVDGLPVLFRDSEKVIVRGFSGMETFNFDATVQRICLAPLRYIHLSYPDRISTTPVRHEVRVKTELPVAITPSGGKAPCQGTITNVSAGGIHIDAPDEFGAKNEEVTVSFSFVVEPNGYEAHIEARALIQSVALQDDPLRGFLFQYGLKLVKLHSSQAILLQNLIYQRLTESHHNLV